MAQFSSTDRKTRDSKTSPALQFPGNPILALVFVAAALTAGGLCAQDSVNPDARRLFDRALQNRTDGDMGRAMDSYLRAFQVDGGVLGLDDQGLIDEIINHLKEQIRSTPTDLPLNFKMAEFLNLSGRVDLAIKFYEKVVKLNPSSQLAQAADLEAKRLGQMQQQQQVVIISPASPDPSASASASAPAAGDPAPDEAERLEAEHRAQIEGLNGTIDGLKKEIATMQDEQKKSEERYKKLEQDFKDLEKKSKRFRSWQNVYFSGGR